MFRVIQIITLIQGLFLLIVIIKNRKLYSKITYYLLLGTIMSVVLYLFGDDETNIFGNNVDVFLFDKSLFITFLFLFVKYFTTQTKKFLKRDFLFFIPNILYFTVELLEIIYSEGIRIIDIIEIGIELSFLSYMLLTFIRLIKVKSQSWMLYFIIPLIILIGFSIIDEILYFFNYNKSIFSITDDHLGSYTIIVVTLLFYTITLKLIISPNDILLSGTSNKYKYSTLDQNQIKKIKEELTQLMTEKKLFETNDISLIKIAEILNIPRAYISEVLNNHMNTNFQDFVNSYRVEAFIHDLKNRDFDQFSLLGMAQNVGFKSKTTFYSAFKKHTGVTPLEYKKNLTDFEK